MVKKWRNFCSVVRRSIEFKNRISRRDFSPGLLLLVSSLRLLLLGAALLLLVSGGGLLLGGGGLLLGRGLLLLVPGLLGSGLLLALLLLARLRGSQGGQAEGACMGKKPWLLIWQLRKE